MVYVFIIVVNLLYGSMVYYRLVNEVYIWGILLRVCFVLYFIILFFLVCVFISKIIFKIKKSEVGFEIIFFF